MFIEIETYMAIFESKKQKKHLLLHLKTEKPNTEK